MEEKLMMDTWHEIEAALRFSREGKYKAERANSKSNKKNRAVKKKWAEMVEYCEGIERRWTEWEERMAA
jgi:putative salt-induced outer membrane protein YdiY